MRYDDFLKMMQKEKVRRKPRHIESDIQQACVEWFRLTYPQYIILSIPNGGSRNALEAANLKKEGALAGASDLLVIAMCSVLFIEMKRKGGKQQESQIRFQKNIERLGHEYKICHSKQEFQMTIERWLKEKYGYEDTYRSKK